MHCHKNYSKLTLYRPLKEYCTYISDVELALNFVFLLLGQDMLDICVPNTQLTVNTTVYVVSPGYPSGMENENLECSCLIQAMATNNAKVHFTVRYVDWNVDPYKNSCWGTLNFKTYDSANNPGFCISDTIDIPLINQTLTRGLVVNFWRVYTRFYSRTGTFKLEINSAGIIFESVYKFMILFK